MIVSVGKRKDLNVNVEPHHTMIEVVVAGDEVETEMMIDGGETMALEEMIEEKVGVVIAGEIEKAVGFTYIRVLFLQTEYICTTFCPTLKLKIVV